MTKRLIKAFGVSLFLLFLGGTIILPAFHRAHCADNHATHDASACPICQVANMPAITPAPDVVLIAGSIASENVVLEIATVPPSFLRDPTQARAPPVA